MKPVNHRDPDERPICVAVQQPALAKYRVPVFRALAARPGIEMTLHYGDEPGIPNAEPDGFAAQQTPLSVRRVLGQTVLSHPAQWRLAGSPNIDVLVLSWNARYVTLVPALLRARRRGTPVLLWGHGYSKSESGLRKQLRDFIGGLATACMFYDHRTAGLAIEAGMDARRVFAAPNALDQEPIQAARSAWLDAPDRLDTFQRDNDLLGKKLLLYVSRMSAKNRLDLLVDALPTLLQDEPQAIVALIGKGQDEQQRLAARASDLGISDRIRFLGPIYDEQQLAPWFLTAQAFVYPSNIGLSLLHAFGYGLPVVTSDKTDSQNPEIVALKPGENGLTYRDNDPQDLAAQLVWLLGDDDLRGRLGAAAHATATGEYSLDAMVDGFVEAIAYCHSQARSD